MTVNKSIILGRLGGAPERRQTNSGTSVANFSVATENYDDETEWHRVVAFGSLADNCAQYLDKGQRVYVEGRMQTSEWQDNDGQTRSTTEVVADDVQFLGGGSGGSSGGSPGPAPSGGDPSGGASESFGGDDIPF